MTTPERLGPEVHDFLASGFIGIGNPRSHWKVLSFDESVTAWIEVSGRGWWPAGGVRNRRMFRAIQAALERTGKGLTVVRTEPGEYEHPPEPTRAAPVGGGATGEAPR